MLKDKIVFKNVDYVDASMFTTHVRDIQQRALILPHHRPKGTSLNLLLCHALKSLGKRMYVKLEEYKPIINIQLTRSEALAVHAAYEIGWLPEQETSKMIFEFIDKKI